MAKANEAAYAASVLDWARLESYARHVASTTSAPQQRELSYTTQDKRKVSIRAAGLRGLLGGTVLREESHDVVHRVVGPHWVLRTYRQQSWEKTRFREETNHFRYAYLLLAEGVLVATCIKRNEVLILPDRTGQQVHVMTQTEGSARAMTPAQALEMDRVLRYVRHKTWEGEQPGDLLRHAKGVGLSLALRTVLRGGKAR